MYGKTTQLWLALVALLTILVSVQIPAPNHRAMFSDQSTHIMASLSIWNDGDLKYTLEDLEEFKPIFPKWGPYGLFLKVGHDDQLYFAKPFLYALFSAPLVGVFGITGFLIFNAICLGLMGVIAIRILCPHVGSTNAFLFSVGLFVFSPFFAWLPVAHPDIFIATLLLVSGYLLLFRNGSHWPAFLGAFVLGLMVYEKPTFIVFAFAVLVVLTLQNPGRKLLVFLALAALGCLLPTAVNILQDGNLLAYQGLRIYAAGPEVYWPLQDKWSGIPQRGITDRVFDIENLILSLWNNLGLIPQKATDFIIGRQTGMVPYFPVALILLLMLIPRLTRFSAWLLACFLGFHLLNWLAFPTNGYGGAGTYGPRYTMQALPVILLAFMLARECKSARKPGFFKNYGIAVLSLLFAIALHYQVLPKSWKLVQNPSTFLLAGKSSIFPYESSLLPVMMYMLPSTFRDIDGNSMLFRTGGDPKACFMYVIDDLPTKNQLVVSQIRDSSELPPIEVLSSQDVLIELASGDVTLASKQIKAFRPTNFRIQNLFTHSYSDLSFKKARWKDLQIRATPAIPGGGKIPGYVSVGFAKSLPDSKTYALGTLSAPNEFDANGIMNEFCWPDPRKLVTGGGISGLSVPLPEDVPENLEIEALIRRTQPKIGTTNDFYVLANGSEVGSIEIDRKYDTQKFRASVTRPFRKQQPDTVLSLLFLKRIESGTQTDFNSSTFEILNFGLYPETAITVEGAGEMSFSKSSPFNRLLGNGWSPPESWGVWSEGSLSTLTIPIHCRGCDHVLKFKLQGYTPPGSVPVEVSVHVNGQPTSEWRIDGLGKMHEVALEVSNVSNSEGTLRVDFHMKNPRSPASLGRGHDSRRLGIGLFSLRVVMEDPD